MSIIITDTKITIDSDDVKLKDIYSYCKSLNKNTILNIENMYVINGNLEIKNSSTLTLLNEALTVTGEKLIIEKGSTLQLGDYDYELNKAINASSLYMPNVLFKYGFGNIDYNNSGNLKCYGSYIEAWCFWSFFEGSNIVELIDSRIYGFGRISGSESIVRNVEFIKAHGRYGTMALNGEIKQYDQLIVKDMLDYKDIKSPVYFNPKYSSNMIITNSVFKNYNTLMYIEHSATNERATLLDCEIENELNIYRSDNNVDVFIKYTFNPIIIDNEGSTLTGVNVKIYDNNNTLVYDDETNILGEVYNELTVIKNDKQNNIIKYNPFKIVLSKDNKVMEYIIFIKRKIDKHIIVFNIGVSNNSNNGTTNIDYDKIKNIVNDAINDGTEFTIFA